MCRHLVALSLLVAVSGGCSHKPALDANGEPLPAGALARIGTSPGKPSEAWVGALLSADGSVLLKIDSSAASVTDWGKRFTTYDPATLKPHGDPVAFEADTGGRAGRLEALSGDGKRVACFDGTRASVYEVGTGKCLLRLPHSGGGVETGRVSLSADGRRVAFGAAFHSREPSKVPLTCAVWDVDAGKELRRVTTNQTGIAEVALSPDGKTLTTNGNRHLMYGGFDRAAPQDQTQIWDVATGAELGRGKWPKLPPVFSPDSRLVAFQESPQQVAVAEARTGKVLATLAVPGQNGRPPRGLYGDPPLAFSPDGKTLALFGWAVLRWDVASGKPVPAAAWPAGVPRQVSRLGLAYPAPDRVVAVAGVGESAYSWEAVGGRLLSGNPSGHTTPISGVTFAAGGTEVVTGARADACRWDATTGELLGRVAFLAGFDAAAVSFSGDGSRGLAAGGGTAEARDLAADAPAGPTFTGRPVYCHTAQFLDPAGTLMAAVIHDKEKVRCRVVTVGSGESVVEVPLRDKAGRVVARLTPDGARLVVGYNTGPLGPDSPILVGTWDAKTGAKLGEFTLAGRGPLRGFALLDADRAVVATGPGGLSVVDFTAGGAERDLPDPERGACAAVAVAPGGGRVAVLQTAAAGGQQVRLYDVATGKVRATWGQGAIAYTGSADPDAAADVLAFSPDGKRLATPAGDATVFVWKVP